MTQVYPRSSPLRAAYERWHDLIPAEERFVSPWHRLVRDHLDIGADVAGRSVLEIACGRGSFARWLAGERQRPGHFVAADFSETAVRKGQAAARDARLASIDWMVADIQSLPFPDETFDTVISCETIEHVRHPARAIAELARVLRRDGRLFLTTPNYLGLMGLYRAYLRLTGRRYTETGQPLNRFTILLLTYLWVRRAGLIVEVIDGRGHYVPWPGRAPIEVHPTWLRKELARWFALHSLVSARKPAR